MTNDGKDIRRLLDEVELPSPRIDLDAVAREGARLRRRRRAGATVGSAVVAIVITSVAVPLALHLPGTAGAVPNGAAATGTPTGGPTATATATPKPAAFCAVSALALPPGVGEGLPDRGRRPHRTVRRRLGELQHDLRHRVVGRHAAEHARTGDPASERGQLPRGGRRQHDGPRRRRRRVYRWANGTTTILSYPMPGRWHPQHLPE